MSKDLDNVYIEFVDYIGRNFHPGMDETVRHAESLTNIVKKELGEKDEE